MEARPQDIDPGAGARGTVELAGARFDPDTGDVDFGETTIRLSPKIADLLLALAEAEGEVLSKDELISRVWPDTVVGDDALWRSMSELRSAFEGGGVTSLVETLPRRGYRLLVPVSQRDAGGDDAPPTPGNADGEEAESSRPEPATPSSESPRRSAAKVGWMAAGMLLIVLSVAGYRMRDPGPSSAMSAPPSPSHTAVVLATFVERRSQAMALRHAGEVPGPELALSPAGFDGLVRSGRQADPASGVAKLAQTMHARGRLRTALALYHSAMDAGAEAPEHRRRAAMAREAIVQNRTTFDTLEIQTADQGAESASWQSGDHLQNLVDRARGLRLDGNYGATLETLKAALREDPGYRPAVLELARAHLAFGDGRNARETLRRSLDAEPRSVELLTLAAEAELILGELETGLDFLDRACLAWDRARRSADSGEARTPTMPRPLLCWL